MCDFECVRLFAVVLCLQVLVLGIADGQLCRACTQGWKGVNRNNSGLGVKIGGQVWGCHLPPNRTPLRCL